VGHPAWTPDFYGRVRFAAGLAAASFPASVVQARIRESRASYVLLGCGSSSIGSLLGPLVADTHHFGCATVYALKSGIASGNGGFSAAARSDNTGTAVRSQRS
jgi:hypothetical protein